MQEKSDAPSVKGKNYADFSRDELIAEINRLKKTKKYGLVWEHKKEEVIESFKAGQQPYLKEVEDKRIENAPGEPTNLIIEGDNFDALSVLNYTHAGKIDVIYIDPPYNTGNKDFIYNDNYVDSEDAFRHSKWLSFMEPRLKLAKSLLKDDGVVFVSIDDNEQSALKLLCDSVFGKENFIANIVWAGNRTGKNDSVNIKNIHEYILAYFKDSKVGKLVGIDDMDDKKYKFSDEKGPYYLITLDQSSLSYSSSMDYVIEHDGRKYYPGIHESGWKERQSGKHGKRDWIWRWGKEKLEYGLNNNLIVFKNNRVYTKQYRDYDFYGNKISRTILMESIIDNYSTRGGKDLLKKLFGEDLFNYAKPIDLIKDLIKLHGSKNDMVFDFFAGSGTTGHAVLELNKEDGGHRQFILCTNNGDKGPDSTKIAEEITYPRIKTVITGKRQDDSEYSDGISANLRYYKIKHEQKLGSNDANRLEMSKHMEDILQIKENAFGEVKAGRAYKLYKNSEKYLCLALDAFEMEKIIEKIAEENKEKLDTVIYSFSYSRDAFEDDYEADFNIEFKAMPEGLLKTYLNITESLRSED